MKFCQEIIFAPLGVVGFLNSGALIHVNLARTQLNSVWTRLFDFSSALSLFGPSVVRFSLHLTHFRLLRRSHVPYVLFFEFAPPKICRANVSGVPEIKKWTWWGLQYPKTQMFIHFYRFQAVVDFTVHGRPNIFSGACRFWVHFWVGYPEAKKKGSHGKAENAFLHLLSRMCMCNRSFVATNALSELVSAQ